MSRELEQAVDKLLEQEPDFGLGTPPTHLRPRHGRWCYECDVKPVLRKAGEMEEAGEEEGVVVDWVVEQIESLLIELLAEVKKSSLPADEELVLEIEDQLATFSPGSLNTYDDINDALVDLYDWADYRKVWLGL